MMAYPGSIPSILILLKLLGLFYQKTLPLSNGPADGRGRGASSLASPYFFVEEHHVRLPIFPTGPGGVVLHPSLTLVPSSASTTSGSHFPDRVRGRGASLPSSPYFFVEKHHVRLPIFPTGPGAWCLIPRQPLFLRPQAPRQAAQALGRLRMRPDIAKSRLFSINVY